VSLKTSFQGLDYLADLGATRKRQTARSKNGGNRNYRARNGVCFEGRNKQQRSCRMMARVSKLSIAGLAIVGSFGLGATGASAQTVYVDPYVQPYPVVVAPGSTYVAPAPIVRERTVVVGRPAYTRAPAYSYRAPIAPYGYAGYHPAYNYAGYDYAGYDYAADVITSDW
jgi:hypothetical protein